MRVILLLLTLLVAQVGAPAASEDANESESDAAARAGESEATSAKSVSVGIYVINILRIDDATQRVTVDFNLNVTWVDETLADGTTTRDLDLGEVWSPDLQIVNEVKLDRLRPERVRVTPDGVVNYRQRFTGDLSCPMRFSEFPWDTQRLSIELVALDGAEIAFRENADFSGRAAELSIANWDIGEDSFVLRSHDALNQKIAGCALEISARRLIGFYILKVFLPLAMIVFMSWAVFWIDPSRIDPQLEVAATAMLTIIAYYFTLSYLVPHLPYLTRMDQFVVGSNVLVFLALVEAVVTSKMYARGSMEQARQLDRVARWAFPVVYLLIVVKMRWL